MTDIGIDLGTSSVLVYEQSKGIVLKEPSVVAINTATGKVVAVGEDAHKMLGRTPDRIRAVRPLKEGVISDFDITQEMLRYFLKKATAGSVVKPRVAICVPSGITEVESRACVNAAASAGARKVNLIEEPVAAALGVGIDITQPNGNMLLDIGGGTSDVAVLSLNGIVVKRSVKVAGTNFDEAIIRYIRNTRGILVGEKMAETIKMTIGSVMFDPHEDTEFEAKGRNLMTGLPERFTVRRSEIFLPLSETVAAITDILKEVLEHTPPELAGDIQRNGIFVTGGGALLHGLDRLIAGKCKVEVHIPENPIECVAIGTGKSFEYIDILVDGFISPITHMR